MTARLLLVAPRDTSFLYSDRVAATLALLQSADRVTPLQQARAERIVLVDLKDEDGCRRVAADLHSRHPFAAAVAFHEPWLELAAHITADLGLVGEPLAAVRAARDKGETRRLAEGSGLANPRYVVLAAGEPLADAVRAVGLPCVVKPARGAGSEGVRVLADAAAVEAYRPSDDEAYLVEEYVPGAEVSVESFTRDGAHDVLAVTDKAVSAGATRVELGHTLPADLPEPTAARIVAGVVELLTRIGHVIGPAHTEVKIDRGVPYLIETHTRYGGDHIWEMTGLVTGRYPQPALLAAHLGEQDVVVPSAGAGAAVRFLAPPPGRVVAVSGVAEAAALDGVVTVDVPVGIGARIAPLRSSDDRAGYVLATGPSAAAAAATADTAAATITVTTEPDG